MGNERTRGEDGGEGVELRMIDRLEHLERNSARGGGTSKLWKYVAGVAIIAVVGLAVNVLTRRSLSAPSLTSESRRDVYSDVISRRDDDDDDDRNPNRPQPPPPNPGGPFGDDDDDNSKERTPKPKEDYLNIKYQGVQYDDPNPECTGLGLFKGTFPDMDYGLMGYNILRGFPLEVGHDPGFTLPIFYTDYTDGFQTADCLWSIPLGYVLLPDVSCVTSFSSETIQTTRALSSSLETKASVSGSGWGAKFSASAGYQTASSSLESGESVIIVSSAECDYYYMKLKEYDPPPFDSLFIKWVEKLNNTDDNNDYLDFFANYGTHYVQQCTFGASFTFESEMTTSKFEEFESQQVDVSVSASYSGIVKVKGSASLSTSESQAASDFREATTSRTITVGAPPPEDGDTNTWASEVKENPLPTKYQLQSIEDLFTDKYFGAGTWMENATIDYVKIKTKIETLKKSYCEQLKTEGLVSDCSDYIDGLSMSSTMLSGSYSEHTDIASNGDCVDLCTKLTNCEATDYCDTCLSSEDLYQVCRTYLAGDLVSASKDEKMVTTLFLPSLSEPAILANTAVSGVQRALNVETVAHAYDCFTQCQDDDYCVAFSWCPCENLAQKCYLYSEVIYNLEEQTGTTTYFLSSTAKLTNTSLLVSFSGESNVKLGPYCTSDADCPLPDTKCLTDSNACACTEGYYYSDTSDACVTSCSSVDNTFMGPYTGYYLDNQNSTSAGSTSACLTLCQGDTSCRSFSAGGSPFTCTISGDTALTDPSNFKTDASYSYYQKNCA